MKLVVRIHQWFGDAQYPIGSTVGYSHNRRVGIDARDSWDQGCSSIHTILDQLCNSASKNSIEFFAGMTLAVRPGSKATEIWYQPNPRGDSHRYIFA